MAAAISRLVSDDQVVDYRRWLDNHRRLRELEDLTLAAATSAADTRPAPAEPGNQLVEYREGGTSR